MPIPREQWQRGLHGSDRLSACPSRPPAFVIWGEGLIWGRYDCREDVTSAISVGYHGETALLTPYDHHLSHLLYAKGGMRGPGGHSGPREQRQISTCMPGLPLNPDEEVAASTKRADLLATDMIHVGVEALRVKLDVSEEPSVVPVDPAPLRLALPIMMFDHHDLGNHVQVPRFEVDLEDDCRSGIPSGIVNGRGNTGRRRATVSPIPPIVSDRRNGGESNSRERSNQPPCKTALSSQHYREAVCSTHSMLRSHTHGCTFLAV